MLNLKTLLTATVITLTGVSGSALAAKASAHEKMQPVAVTVAEVLQDNHKSKRIALRGTITKQEAKGKFLFEDSTGDITLDIDSKLTDETPITPPVKTEIMGEIDQGLISDTEIKVFSYQLLP